MSCFNKHKLDEGNLKMNNNFLKVGLKASKRVDYFAKSLFLKNSCLLEIKECKRKRITFPVCYYK